MPFIRAWLLGVREKFLEKVIPDASGREKFLAKWNCMAVML